jgi:hypothetical protein
MINYAKWRPHSAPAEIQAAHPACLTPKQRRAFWLTAAGKSRKQVAADMDVCINTLRSFKAQIHERIPGLTSNTAYGTLAVEIIRGIENDTRLDIPVQLVVSNSATGRGESEPERSGASPR